MIWCPEKSSPEGAGTHLGDPCWDPLFPALGLAAAKPGVGRGQRGCSGVLGGSLRGLPGGEWMAAVHGALVHSRDYFSGCVNCPFLGRFLRL